VFSFVLSHVSVGGHIGGLIGGVLVGVAYDLADRRRMPALAYVGCLVLAVLAVVGALSAAGG
jgi:membrane associated rhomboid family serine protease